ncbi:MAG TPA: hypothetical protein PLP33_24630 [Leptospiraceae bacterium]|nr:hypothetical protein [Leptospiraceae bacterium]
MPHTVKNNRQAGKFERHYSCDSCQLLRINGKVCHETGCPEAWKDETIECNECGCNFEPEMKGQKYCSDHCYNSGYGFDCYCEFCAKEDTEEEE